MAFWFTTRRPPFLGVAVSNPAKGRVYRHYKGGLYHVHAIAIDADDDTDTGDAKVVYSCCRTQKVFVRSASSWSSAPAQGVERFTPLE